MNFAFHVLEDIFIIPVMSVYKGRNSLKDVENWLILFSWAEFIQI